jgi:transposase-like protein
MQASLSASKPACPNGHVYDTANTYFYEEKRKGRVRYRCKTCHRERVRQAAIRKRGYV